VDSGRDHPVEVRQRRRHVDGLIRGELRRGSREHAPPGDIHNTRPRKVPKAGVRVRQDRLWKDNNAARNFNETNPRGLTADEPE
jgi:hypothetical protein